MHVESEGAANDRASVAISQASYDSLRKSVDTLRDQFREAQDGRKAAMDELRAERAKTEDTLARDEAVRGAEARA